MPRVCRSGAWLRPVSADGRQGRRLGSRSDFLKRTNVQRDLTVIFKDNYESENIRGDNDKGIVRNVDELLSLRSIAVA